MIEPCINNLSEIKSALENISNEGYVNKLTVLSESSIGQHVRHVLEFYTCFLKGIESGTINYDLRERDLKIEEDKIVAIGTIEHIQEELSKVPTEKLLSLEGDSGVSVPEPYSIETNCMRELAYNLEHSIHHQALIKIGLRELNFEKIIGKDFGVAPSTVRSN